VRILHAVQHQHQGLAASAFDQFHQVMLVPGLGRRVTRDRTLVAQATGHAVERLLGNATHVDAHAPRLLLRTDAWADHARFPEAVPTLAEGAVAFLSAHGTRLVGVDLPSIDALDSTTLPVHRAVHRAGIQILENLDLRNVPAGRYELIALPLKLAGADGAPVRAVLREERR